LHWKGFSLLPAPSFAYKYISSPGNSIPQAWEDTGTDQKDTLGMGKDSTATAKGRGEGRRTTEAETRG